MERSDRAPTVYDDEGNPLRVRLVDHVAVGEVSGEGHYGYEHKLTSEHATICFEEDDSDEENSFFEGTKPFAAHLQGLAAGIGMTAGLLADTAPEILTAVWVAFVLVTVGYVFDRGAENAESEGSEASATQDTGVSQEGDVQ